MAGPQHHLTRRRLLATGAAAAAATALPALGRPASPPQRKLSANDRVNIGFIGIGNYGAQNLVALANENIVAVCDIDWRTSAQNPGNFTWAPEVAAKYPTAKRFDDWRVMYDKLGSELDAVVVCTADHVHANAALASMQLGKHTYCEKPLAAKIDEVRAMQRAASANPRLMTQTGIVGHASEDVRLIVEWLRDGVIGTVQRMDIYQTDWAAGKRYATPYDELSLIRNSTPTPAEVHWNPFLGPAPARPYQPMYIPLRWRNWQDFGTGIIGDHGPHFLDPVVWGLDLDWPESIVAATDPEYTAAIKQQMFPHHSRVTYRFPARGKRAAVELKWWGYDTPPVPPGWPKDKELPTGGGIVYGSKGVLMYGPVYSSKPGAQKQVWIFPEELDRAYKRPTPTLPRPTGHQTEWTDAIRSGTQPSCNWQYGGHITELCLLGNLAIAEAGKTLTFDPTKRRFTNSPTANAAFGRERRKGWELPA